MAIQIKVHDGELSQHEIDSYLDELKNNIRIDRFTLLNSVLTALMLMSNTDTKAYRFIVSAVLPATLSVILRSSTTLRDQS